MRLKIDVKEELWGQTSVKGKTVDKIILTEVSQTGKEKKEKQFMNLGNPIQKQSGRVLCVDTVWQPSACAERRP